MASLLFMGNGSTGQIDKITISNFFIDRSLELICADRKKTQSFLDIISHPLLESESILFRQEILKDFLKEPQFLQDITGLFQKLEELKKRHYETRKQQSVFLTDWTSKGNDQGALNLLKISALNLKRTLILLKMISSTFDNYNYCSEGLQAINKEIKSIVLPQEYNDLIELCTRFEFLSQVDPITILISINDMGKIYRCDLAKSYFFADDKRVFKNKRRRSNEREKEKKDSISFQVVNDTTFQDIRNVSFGKIKAYFDSLFNQIISSFSRIYDECDFYSVALDYCRFLKECGCNLCFPIFSSKKEEAMIGVRDLYLVLHYKDSTEVVPNDFCANKDGRQGTIILGKNNGGKTVFLRSIGTTQIFAQAGLPVIAQLTRIHIYDSIVSQFADSERHGENESGRFEKEVKDMALIVDNATNNSLILLNEVFQSTAFEEGAYALSNILQYFSSIKANWILATHLLQICDLLSNKSRFLHVHENYKII